MVPVLPAMSGRLSAAAFAAVPVRVTSRSNWVMTKALRASIARIDGSKVWGLVSCNTRPFESVTREISTGLMR